MAVGTNGVRNYVEENKRGDGAHKVVVVKMLGRQGSKGRGGGGGVLGIHLG